MKATCSANPDHNTFLTTITAITTQVVDSAGRVVEGEIPDTDFVTVSGPDPKKTWICAKCGAQASVTFNLSMKDLRDRLPECNESREVIIEIWGPNPEDDLQEVLHLNEIMTSNKELQLRAYREKKELIDPYTKANVHPLHHYNYWLRAVVNYETEEGYNDWVITQIGLE